MTEQAAVTTIKNILNGRIACEVEIISRKVADKVSYMLVTIAVICKKDKVTPEIIADLMDYDIQNHQNDSYLILLETQKELGNLDWEVILLEAKIQYLKGA